MEHAKSELEWESFLSYDCKRPRKCPRGCKCVDKGNTVESESESSFESQLKRRKLDVASLLSNNGKTTYLVRSNGQFVALDSIRGKHIVICCVSLPVTSDDQHWRAIMATYSELPHTNFEMVVVPSGNNKADFVRCLSHVPCLAVPFSDKSTRKSICSSIGFNPHTTCKSISTILLDPTGSILRCCWIPQLFYDYGSEWFYRNEDDIHLEDIVLRLRLDPLYKYNDECLPEAIKRVALCDEPLSLHKDILLCEPSDTLYRFGGGQSSTVSELSNKYVGLYLCINMRFLEKLNEIHQQCLANKLELEIVLVCLPLFEDTKLYHKELINALKGCKIKSWFIFPYEHKICRRLWRVFSQEWDIDRMIILPPNGKPGELEGRTVVEELGINAYPFIRSTILEKRFTALKSLNPATWFKGTHKRRTCLVRNGTTSNVPQSAINGKKLLLYLDWLLLSDGTELLHLLMKHYSEIQSMGCEVVFIPLNITDRNQLQPHVELGTMPWPIMPVSAAIKASVVNQLIFRSRNYQLIAFEENGEIVSTQAMERLKKRGVTDYLFHDELRKEVTAELTLLENQEDEY
ncbi:putative nucleoredoxin 1 [Silene latifolia]|uniref:putative nucleoredoxin 1 n=1 Tax=Silene latifolia TaxID=37657 RepID=UPI003D77221F